MQEFITMNHPEVHRVEVIQKLSDKRLTECEAAEQCHLSVRQIRRLKKLYLALGAQGLISKKRGKAGNHRYPSR
jgi:predicted nucleic acid-binding Zn ribbon protein